MQNEITDLVLLPVEVVDVCDRYFKFGAEFLLCNVAFLLLKTPLFSSPVLFEFS